MEEFATAGALWARAADCLGMVWPFGIGQVNTYASFDGRVVTFKKSDDTVVAELKLLDDAEVGINDGWYRWVTASTQERVMPPHLPSDVSEAQAKAVREWLIDLLYPGAEVTWGSAPLTKANLEVQLQDPYRFLYHVTLPGIVLLDWEPNAPTGLWCPVDLFGFWMSFAEGNEGYEAIQPVTLEEPWRTNLTGPFGLVDVARADQVMSLHALADGLRRGLTEKRAVVERHDGRVLAEFPASGEATLDPPRLPTMDAAILRVARAVRVVNALPWLLRGDGGEQIDVRSGLLIPGGEQQ